MPASNATTARRRRRCLAATLAALVVAACTGGDDGATPSTPTTPTTEPGYPLDDVLRLNDVQVVGTHNSYHVAPEGPLLELLRAFDATLADAIEYDHATLADQLATQGVRQLELDVYADPDGGLYASPAGARLAGLPAPDDPALAEPGFKVLHTQDVDYRTTCPTLVACLTEVRRWSEANPGHVPVLVLLELKQDPIPDPVDAGFVVPVPIGAAELDALDAEIRSVFDDDHLLTPDDVRGSRASLEEAVLADGWPTLGEVRGQVLFALDNEDEVRGHYVEGHAGLAGRVSFTSSPPGTPEAAFLKLNDAVASEDTIRQAVLDGYLVRTRADADTIAARTGDTSRRDTALRTGAQFVSTDYPVDEPRFEPDYSVTIPGGTPAGCNPVRAPDPCTGDAVEDPALLTAN